MSHYPHVIGRHIFSIRIQWFIFISIANVIFLSCHRTVDLKYNISKCERTFSVRSFCTPITHYVSALVDCSIRSQSFYLFACTSVPSALRLKRRRKGIDFAFKVQARNVGHQAIIFIILNHTLSFIIV